MSRLLVRRTCERRFQVGVALFQRGKSKLLRVATHYRFGGSPFQREQFHVKMPAHRFYVQFGARGKELASQYLSLTQPIDLLDEMNPANQKQEKGPAFAIKQYYRRSLPKTCISFCSKEGQEIFKEALSTGHMQCYFRLAAQFRTQDEPAYCGLSTLVMILNSLEVDPGKLWKGCWRWYHEEMLDCCEPLEKVKEKGINFEQFICLAHCNYLKADTVRGAEDMSEEKFRDVVKKYTKIDDCFIVASYSRPALGQTGSGHFSPIAGYHPEKDLVLILDVARFKYPPHWVSLKLLVESMKELDLSTGKPRGYMVLRKQEGRLPLLLFRISSALAVTQGERIKEGMKECIRQWNNWLTEKRTGFSDMIEGTDLLTDVIAHLLEILKSLPDECCVLTTQIDIKCDEVSCDHVCAVCQLLKDIELTELFQAIENNLEAGRFSSLSKIGIVALPPDFIPQNRDCSILNGLTSAHFLTVLLLSWPYGKEMDTYGSMMGLYTSQLIDNSTQLMRNEILNLRKQLATVFDVYGCCCRQRMIDTL